jgi:hypothetical protein
MQKTQQTNFESEQAAAEYMYEQVDDLCVDNYRFAYDDDSEAVMKYKESQNHGCCGFYDQEIKINGRPAMIGCNYGH